MKSDSDIKEILNQPDFVELQELIHEQLGVPLKECELCANLLDPYGCPMSSYWWAHPSTLDTTYETSDIHSRGFMEFADEDEKQFHLTLYCDIHRKVQAEFDEPA